MRTRNDVQAAAERAGASVVDAQEVDTSGDGSTDLVTRVSYEDPWAAAHFLKELADEDSADPVVLAWAKQILAGVAKAKGITLQPGMRVTPGLRMLMARAIHKNVSEQIRFVEDAPIGERVAKLMGGAPVEEVFQSARYTMKRRAGDCDDHARLVYALARSVNLPARLIFFEKDSQPVHVVAILGDGTNFYWAETTLRKQGGARFGEHPVEALKRLGIHNRSDIGTLIASQEELDQTAAQLFAYADGLDVAIKACTTAGAISDADRAAWAGEYQSLQVVKASIENAETNWMYKINPVAQSMRFARLLDEINTHRPMLAAYADKVNKCAGGGGMVPLKVVPPVPGGDKPPPTDWVGVAKIVGGAVIVLSVVYLVGPLVHAGSASVAKRVNPEPLFA